METYVRQMRGEAGRVFEATVPCFNCGGPVHVGPEVCRCVPSAVTFSGARCEECDIKNTVRVELIDPFDSGDRTE